MRKKAETKKEEIKSEAETELEKLPEIPPAPVFNRRNPIVPLIKERDQPDYNKISKSNILGSNSQIPRISNVPNQNGNGIKWMCQKYFR